MATDASSGLTAATSKAPSRMELCMDLVPTYGKMVGSTKATISSTKSTERAPTLIPTVASTVANGSTACSTDTDA